MLGFHGYMSEIFIMKCFCKQTKFHWEIYRYHSFFFFFSLAFLLLFLISALHRVLKVMINVSWSRFSNDNSEEEICI